MQTNKYTIPSLSLKIVYNNDEYEVMPKFTLHFIFFYMPCLFNIWLFFLWDLIFVHWWIHEN